MEVTTLSWICCMIPPGLPELNILIPFKRVYKDILQAFGGISRCQNDLWSPAYVPFTAPGNQQTFLWPTSLCLIFQHQPVYYTLRTVYPAITQGGLLNLLLLGRGSASGVTIAGSEWSCCVIPDLLSLRVYKESGLTSSAAPALLHQKKGTSIVGQ